MGKKNKKRQRRGEERRSNLGWGIGRISSPILWDSPNPPFIRRRLRHLSLPPNWFLRVYQNPSESGLGFRPAIDLWGRDRIRDHRTWPACGRVPLLPIWVQTHYSFLRSHELNTYSRISLHPFHSRFQVKPASLGYALLHVSLSHKFDQRVL